MDEQVKVTTNDDIRDYLMTRRQALLLELDMLERMLKISPRVAELRKSAKDERTGKENAYNYDG